MKYTYLITVLCLLLGTMHSNAQNNYIPDRPGIGNGAYVTEPGVFGLETGFQISKDDIVNQFDIGQILLRFGLIENIELRALLNSYSTQNFDKTDIVNSGFQDVGLAVKYQVFSSNETGTRGSLLGKVSFPVGASAFSTNEVVPTVFALADQSITEYVGISANLGYTFGAGGLDESWLFTLTPGMSIPGQENVGIYAGYASILYGSSPNEQYGEAGITLTVNDGAQIDINAGYEFNEGAFFVGIGFANGFNRFRN